jgi:hypothetical protein
MNSRQPFRFLRIAILTPLLGAGLLSYAQQTVDVHGSKLAFEDAPAVDGQSPSTGTPTSHNSTTADDGWHFVVAPYLWLPWTYGTVGGLGREVHVYADPSQIFSHFRFGLMGLIEADHKRVVLPLDIIWARFGDDKALPFPNVLATTANVKVDEFILTPKIGYRLLDQEKIKIDALTGFRYWHLGQNLQFSPSRLGLNFSGSQNWVDPLVGGRILGVLTPKVNLSIGGDVGGWGTGSQLDYQIAGLLGYKIKPKWTLEGGYRYLDVNYRSKTIYDAATSGIVLGVSINLK